MNKAQQKILSDIQTHGFSMVCVFDPDEQLPIFGYTIGLYHTKRLPEIIIVGLPQETIFSLLSLIAQSMLSGTIHEAGQITTELLKGDFPCFFGAVTPNYYEDYVYQAIGYYREKMFPLLQCVWSDTQGHFPWHPQATLQFQAQQPLLFDPTFYDIYPGNI